MHIRKVLFILLLIIPMSTWGQHKLIIAGSIEDYVTHHPIPESSVSLLSVDSTVIVSTIAGGFLMSNGKIVERHANFYLKIPNENKYIIQVQKEGYDIRYITIDISQIHNREIERKIPAIYLQQTIAKKLEEVTITATKVKFYNKGDTLIYNADAFRLAEGSMLDALIRQLPGTELRSDGRIYVNGKFIENLLLRGKLADMVKELGWELSVVLRPDESSKKFQVLPLRWIMERTFVWIENYRRMTTNYEYKTELAEIISQITCCPIMIKKLF